MDPALHTPHDRAFSESFLGPQEHSRKTYPTKKMLIFHEKGGLFANVQYHISQQPEFSHYGRLCGYVGWGEGLPNPLGVTLSKPLLQPQEPSRNRHDTRLK